MSSLALINTSLARMPASAGGGVDGRTVGVVPSGSSARTALIGRSLLDNATSLAAHRLRNVVRRACRRRARRHRCRRRRPTRLPGRRSRSGGCRLFRFRRWEERLARQLGRRRSARSNTVGRALTQPAGIRRHEGCQPCGRRRTELAARIPAASARPSGRHEQCGNRDGGVARHVDARTDARRRAGRRAWNLLGEGQRRGRASGGDCAQPPAVRSACPCASGLDLAAPRWWVAATFGGWQCRSRGGTLRPCQARRSTRTSPAPRNCATASPPSAAARRSSSTAPAPASRC